MAERKEPFGRPKEHDRIQIGKDMVEWATDNIDALTVPMFATSIGLHSGILRNWASEDKDFHALYMEAKELIGINRLNCSRAETLDNGIYRQTIAHYDLDSKAEIREEKAYESSLRKDEDGSRETTVNVRVSKDGLGRGVKISAEGIPVTDNRSS